MSDIDYLNCIFRAHRALFDAHLKDESDESRDDMRRLDTIEGSLAVRYPRPLVTRARRRYFAS